MKYGSSRRVAIAMAQEIKLLGLSLAFRLFKDTSQTFFDGYCVYK